MTVYLPAWHSHCTRARFTIVVSGSDKIAVHWSPLLYLQRRVAKLASGLFYCWLLLCNNNMAANLQWFTSGYGSRRFRIVACYGSRRFVALLNAHLEGNAARRDCW